MRDWVSLVENFFDTFRKTTLEETASPIAPSNGVDFLRSTVLLHKDQETAKVLTNVNVAAFYINFLLEVRNSCRRCTLPYLIIIEGPRRFSRKDG